MLGMYKKRQLRKYILKLGGRYPDFLDVTSDKKARIRGTFWP